MGPPGNRGSCVLVPVSLPKLKKAYEKGTRGISWGPLLTPGLSGSARVSKWSICPWLTNGTPPAGPHSSVWVVRLH
ncbi:unnamed protein product [Staurois parvus]|uniref:Uncharacterized protein n=1 Tax=Staurois parvus TaxID=386267 RepID=A0ABN9CY72_9NEOB|nr:unnamed protein product [Staurois parvus]